MPASTRRPRRRFSLPVILYAHPFELALGFAFAALGIRGLIADVTSPSVDALPELPLLLYRLGSIIAGLGIIAGLIMRQRPIGRAIERASCYVLAGVLGAFALILLVVNGWDAFATGLVCIALGAACFFRARAIAKTERVILEQLRAANAIAVADLLKIIDGRPASEERDNG
jgi:uncharacterized integral membrane protein